MTGTILVVEDETIPRKNICRVLHEEGYRVHEVADGQAALVAIDERDFDLVLTDLRIPGADGLDVLQHVRDVAPQTFVAIMTAHASVDTAVAALQLGAQDYLLKPIMFDDLLRKVHLLMEHKSLAWENQMLRREVNRHIDPSGMVGQSPAMREVLKMITKVAPAASTVLITGESGVGKELVARAIHAESQRRDKVFLPVNCSAIPDTLLESQLFGHTKGAFTGALSAQDGLFRKAQGGTIFLDEIGELPLTLQPKLLRVIERKEVLPVGATTPIQVDVRILAASNRDLEKEIVAGRFREDLFYRLNVVGIVVPPLRERRIDIPPLVEYLIQRHNVEMKKNCKGVTHEAMQLLIAAPWKGNVREMENVLERAMILGNDEWLGPEDFPGGDAFGRAPGQAAGYELKSVLQGYEKSHIEHVLREAGQDRVRTAKLLGISRSSLYRKMEQLGIALDRASPPEPSQAC